MMYWHALSGGLTEFIPAMYQYYAGHLEDFRENARKLFGCRGIFIPAGTTPLTGLPSQVVPVILNWTGAAGWLAQHFYQYYLFTGDAKFLVEKALPFMAEAALFYEDFLEEQKDGRLQIYPSVSPENSPKNYITPEAAALGHPMPSTINATMDIAIIKELLTNLLHASEATDLYGDKREIWQSMLEKLPAYEQNSDGAIKEWLNPDFEDNYNHRHLSHLYPVFPGQEVSREENGDLFDGFVTAVKKRLVVGISDQSGWSLAHMANIYARLEDGESALECLELLSRSCLTNNFYTLHNDWRNMGITLTMKAAPIQLDANLGWTAAVQEMLLFVSPRLVRVLPACPKKWIKGSVTGMRFTTGKISFTWDRTLHTLSAVLVADRATDIILKLPDGYGEYDFVCNEGVVSKLEEPNFWRIEMQAQSQLKIVSQPNK